MNRNESIENLDKLISQKQWAEALTVLQSNKESLSKEENLLLGLVYYNLKRDALCLSHFTMLGWDDYRDCAWLRRMIIAPLIKAEKWREATALLELILQAHPHSVLDLTTLSRLLIRLNKRTLAASSLEKVLVIEPHHFDAAAQLMQLRLQENQLQQALKLAEQYEHAYPLHERLFHMGLLTLSKGGQFKRCIDHITHCNLAQRSLHFQLMAAQIAVDGQAWLLADNILTKLLAQNQQEARMYLLKGRVQLKLKKTDEAIASLIKASQLEPQHIQINNLLGDTLLRTGHYKQSLPYLEQLKNALPNNPHTRLLNARALKFAGDYEQAANEMLAVTRLLPESTTWKRYTASALIQAGRHTEANHVFDQAIAIRNRALAPTFEQGLHPLQHKIATVTLPQARFDWLWQMVSPHHQMSEEAKSLYETKAKYNYLLDHYLLDWLECRPLQADEPMAFLEDLSEVSAQFEKGLSKGKGILLASAHVGCLYAGPLALDLLGFPYQWLASTPNIPTMAYYSTLISTSVHTEVEVVRQVMQALRQGKIMTIAVDGAMNPAAPKIEFEGQQITYSDFTARMAFRVGSPSFFAIPFWKEHAFCIKLEPLPDPFVGESVEQFCMRWTTAYLNLLRQFIRENPDNARLSGGIWRSVSLDRTVDTDPKKS